MVFSVGNVERNFLPLLFPYNNNNNNNNKKQRGLLELSWKGRWWNAEMIYWETKIEINVDAFHFSEPSRRSLFFTWNRWKHFKKM